WAPPGHGSVAFCGRWNDQPHHTRALRNMRIHGESSPQFSGCQLNCTLRNTRSGCGIRMVTRPSAAVKPARPPGEPLVLSGKLSVGLPRLSTKRTAPCDLDGLHTCGKLTRPSPCATATGIREPVMPLKNRLGESRISSVATRDSYCSDALRRNFGQCCAPGMISFSCDSIWQPLHTPSANFVSSAKNAVNCSRKSSL